MFDALFGVAVAYAENVFVSPSQSPTLYVLDIGLYLVSALRELFPEFTFIPFSSLAAVPSYAAPIDIYGIGMPSFQSYNPFLNHTYYSTPTTRARTTVNATAVIRSVFYSQLKVTPVAKCVVILSRLEDETHLQRFHDKAILDQSREAFGLSEYHDTGASVHTAMHYYASTSQHRRSIVNEEELFRVTRDALAGSYSCIKKVTLASMTLRQQLQVFANAALVIGQHGAGLVWTAFMPYGAHVIELEPRVNPVFHFSCVAAGVHHTFVHREHDRFQHVYSSAKGNATITLDVPALTHVFPEIYHRNHSHSFSSTQQRKNNEAESHVNRLSALSEAPEIGYVTDMIRVNSLPFIWRDSAFGNNRWAKYTRDEWQSALRRY